MINGLDIYYTSKNIGRGLRPVSTNYNKQQTVSIKAKGLKPVSKGKGCKRVGRGLRILQ